MRLPLELIVVFLIADLYGAKVEKLSSVSQGAVLWSFAAMAALFALMYVISLAGSAWSIRRARQNPAESTRIFDAHGRLLAAERALLVVMYVALVHHTQWCAIVVHRGGLDAEMTVIGDDLLKILPFLLGSLAMWLGNYPASKALSPAKWGIRDYLRGQARGLFFLLGPWMMMVGLSGSRLYWPQSVVQYFDEHAWAQVAGYVGGLLALLLLFPFFLIHLWPHRPFPPGPFRERLERLLKRAGVRCRDLAVWDTGSGRMSNAAVMGPVPWSRYIVFTDALLEDLDEDETEAVLAHELGHVRFYHIGFYMVFFMVFMASAIVLSRYLPSAVVSRDELMVVLLIGLLLFYWRIVFGFLSRRFERQADVAACEMVGGPRPLMSALEKLARASGGSRTANNWRHYSVAERVAFLARFGFDREALQEYHRMVRVIKGLSLFMLAMLIAVLAPTVAGALVTTDRKALVRQLKRRLKEEGHSYEIHAQLGEALLELGRYDEAWGPFGKAIELDSRYPNGYRGRARICMEESSSHYDLEKALDQAGKAVKYSERMTDRLHGKIELARDYGVLAKAAFRNGNRRLAVTTINKALGLEFDDSELVNELQRDSRKYMRAARQAEDERKKPEGSP